MKKTGLKVLCELMKNSKQSDRELAKKIGVSQPTVTRARKRLEKDGYIKEYTIIPHFSKLGYELLAFIFLHYHRPLSDEEYQKVETEARELAKKMPHTTLLIMGGTGFGHERVIVSLHENYASFRKLLEIINQTSVRPIVSIQTFIAPLEAERHFQSLTLSMISEHLAAMQTNLNL